MSASTLLRKLEVKPTEDEYESIGTSRWGNRDVYPIPHDKRTYGVYAFVSYWGELMTQLQNQQLPPTKRFRNMRHLPVIMDNWK